MRSLAVADDDLFLEHRAPEAHPERPERLLAARRAVEAAGLPRALGGGRNALLPARDATDDELVRVHHPAFVAALSRLDGRRGWLDADTFHAPRSVQAARRAAGAAVQVVEALLDGVADHAVALVRPPGHHARPGAAMGFCLLNNVAVAAAHARARGLERVAIVDWDVHHGNGTEEMFREEPGVLYVSLHQAPFYPGTGAAEDVGAGEGRGFTVNVPLGAGATRAVYRQAFERIVLPVLAEYRPELVLVSAGFDAHRADPLAAMALDDAAYADMARGLAAVLPEHGRGRLGLVLEGGYDLAAVEGALAATLRALGALAPTEAGGAVAAAPDQPPAAALSPRHEAELAQALAAARASWRL